MWTIFPPCFTARVRLLKLKITCTPFCKVGPNLNSFSCGFMWYFLYFVIYFFLSQLVPAPGGPVFLHKARRNRPPLMLIVNCLIHGSNKRKVEKENTEPNSQKALGSLAPTQAPTVVDAGAYSVICASPPKSSIVH